MYRLASWRAEPLRVVETYSRTDSHLVPLPVVVVIVIMVDEEMPVGVIPADGRSAPALTGAICMRADRKAEDMT